MEVDDGVPEKEFDLACGVVSGGQEVRDPVTSDEGIPVYVRDVLSANLVVVEVTNDDGTRGEILVRLHGVKDSPATKRNAAINRLNSLSGGQAYLYKAADSCDITVAGGGSGIAGALVNNAGVSFAEDIIRAGLADPETADVCGGELIGACLASIAGSTPQTAGELDSFLWKPTSDSNGNLAIHTGPYNTDVYVNGEKGVNQGAGNGYGSLARFSKPGCSYPSPRIQVYNGSSGLPYSVNGRTTLTVSSPCSRHCLKEGSIQPCQK